MRTEKFFEKAVTALLVEENLLVTERNELVQKHNCKTVRWCFSSGSDDARRAFEALRRYS